MAPLVLVTEKKFSLVGQSVFVLHPEVLHDFCGAPCVDFGPYVFSERVGGVR